MLSIQDLVKDYEVLMRCVGYFQLLFLLLGGKARITAPIPWVAPYVEGGIGASIGSFETVTPGTSLQASGLIYHIPFTVGLSLGPWHNVDVAFTYYFHPTVRQYAGAAAFGISIPLK